MRKLKIDLPRLLILSTTTSFLSAVTLMVYIFLGLSHASVPFALTKDLFVLGSTLGTFAEILELLLVIPLVKKAENTKARAILILALIPYVNLLLLLAFFVIWLIAKTQQSRHEMMSAAKDALRDAPGQVTSPPEAPRKGNVPSSTTPTMKTPAASLQDGGIAGVVGAVGGAGSAGAVGVKAATAASPAGPKSLHAVLTNALGVHTANAIITPIRRALPVIVLSTLATTAATITVGAAAIVNPPPLIGTAPTPTSGVVSKVFTPTLVPQSTTIPTSTATTIVSQPTATPLSTATAIPTHPPVPTSRPRPTATPTPHPTATSTPAPVNLLQDPNFTNDYPAGDTGAHCTGPNAPLPFAGGGNGSAAASWTLFNNTLAITSTHLVASTRVVGKTMLHVCTTGGDNGIVQVFAPQPNGGPAHVEASMWVYVVSGRVGMGSGNGGNSPGTAFSQTTGQWESLQTPNGVSPGNEIILYNVSPTGGDFYVDTASIQPFS